MKKLINRPESVVEEMVDGLAAIYPGMVRLPGHTVLARSDLPAAEDRPVGVLSGGGSGHEPAHAGYIGRGMLSAAVAGEVFTSPSPDAVLAAIRGVAGPKGVLLVVKNYTGDRLNFGLAAEMARAEGIPVETVLVADDVAVPGSAGAGPRGLAGTILVHKVAGAVAEGGAPLADVSRAARAVADAVRTMGVALTPCTVPAVGKPGFTLGENEIELGLGIHGEPGVRRGPLESADALVDHLLNAILPRLPESSPRRIALLINNLGGTPTMELAIVARRAMSVLHEAGFTLERVYMGTFLSALEMAGVSLSVLPVTDAILNWLDAPTDAPAWPNAATRPPVRGTVTRPAPTPATVAAPIEPRTPHGQRLKAALQRIANALISEAPRLTALDQAVGDGDLGISLERAARSLLDALPTCPLDDPGTTLHHLGRAIQGAMGGTSGPLYGTLLFRACSVLRGRPVDDLRGWTEALRAGCVAIHELGGADRGDRTMLDALLPAADALESAVQAGKTGPDAMHDAANAAAEGAKATGQMLPRRGRASYLGERAIGHIDPGAEAVAVWLAALAG